ncbi:MAG: hypothetical protein AAFQ19_17065 [Pseudomonadota bacterium]
MRNAVTAVFLAAPQIAASHDGAHTLDMLARVTATSVSGGTVRVALTLTGLGGPLVLTGFSVADAAVDPITPVYVDFAQDAAAVARVHFEGPVPSLFTLHMGFGPVGEGSVVVFPDPGDGTRP